MPRLLPCIHRLENGRPCGELSPRSRCIEHRKIYEKQRLEKEPWLWFYKDPRWASARKKVFARDGTRCTFAIGNRRCNTDVEVLLEVHHEPKLRAIWEQYGKPQRGAPRWAAFVQAGCDQRKLRTVCTEHHKQIDMVEFKDGIRRSMNPGAAATSQQRRGIRASKRRRNEKINKLSRRKRSEER